MAFEASDILQPGLAGLYCPDGDFHIDPERRVARAVITHAHSDHARPGMGGYICSATCAPLLRERVGGKAPVTAVPFGEQVVIGRAAVSFHPAGHILGSAQVRVEARGRVAVVTGDYNASHAHGAAEPFEAVRCDLLVTESTFGLPVYHWPEPAQVMEDIHAWWRANQALGRTSVLPCYPLGKTQRLLAALDTAIGPVAVAGAGRGFLPHFAAAGVVLPEAPNLDQDTLPLLRGRGLVLVSFAGREPELLRGLEPLSCAAVSGWMQVRARRRGDGFDRGFVLSDHSDWNGLLRCVRESGARRVGVTHGQTEVFARYLREACGLDAFSVPQGA